MSVNNFDQVKGCLADLEKLYFSDQKNILENTDQLIQLLNECPALAHDQQSIESIRRLTEGIYAMKALLPNEKQVKITELFLTTHGINATRIENLLKNDQPAKNLWMQHKEGQAVIRGRQEYPVPMALLKDEEMPCQTYFKSIPVELNDGSQVRISQGLLAHFSGMVGAMVKHGEMKIPEKLVLQQLDRHQFDSLVAFLVTGKSELINEENVLSLMYTAAYLQIPDVIEACKQFVYPNLDDKMIVHLLNLFHGEENHMDTAKLEKRLSEIFCKGLVQKPVSKEFLEKLAYYKENLVSPISLRLSGTDITDEALELLDGLPIRELHLLYCQMLTQDCLPIIKRLSDIKVLKLGGNKWVDDHVLSNIPSNIKSLSIATCQNFTKQGLVSLKNSNVRSLDLSGCRQLNDEDFVNMPDQFDSLDLSTCKGVGKQTMARLGAMTKLRHLKLIGTPVNDDDISLLHKHFISLDLSSCPLSDAAIGAISTMDQLKDLSLSSTGISGEQLSLLPDSLNLLRLDRCWGLTDASIIPFASRKNLRFLGLLSCNKITREAIDAFSDTEIKVGWQEAQASHMALTSFTQ